MFLSLYKKNVEKITGRLKEILKMNDMKRSVEINVDLETGETPQLNSSNKDKTVRDIRCSKKINLNTHEMSDWQNLASRLEHRVNE